MRVQELHLRTDAPASPSPEEDLMKDDIVIGLCIVCFLGGAVTMMILYSIMDEYMDRKFRAKSE